MGKRSPILGYNHNVRYRGLVFHVQTEDSGVATPHLFTHLFHSGVIVSTRKLVYDAGSAEDSIKSLMQAQHKATLKDLRRGHFDDKIDSYLGGTPGLLPRGSEDRGAKVDADAEVTPPPAPPPIALDDLAVGAPTEQVLPEQLSEPVLITERPTRQPPIPPPPLPRVATARQPALGRGTPASVDTTLKTAVPVFTDAAVADDATQAVMSLLDETTLGGDAPQIDELDAPEIEAHEDDAGELSSAELDAPEIEIQLELDDNDEAVSRASTVSMSGPPALPRRATRDTELQTPFDATRPTLEVPLDEHTRPTLGMVNEEARRATTISDGIPGPVRASSPAIPPPPPATDTRRLGERASTINASALPPARPISRPQARPAMTQPQVVARPMAPDERKDERSKRESEAVEVYSPAPASAELPSGQYAQHKKVSQRIPVEGLKNERSGGVAIPAGLGRPHRASTPAATAGRPGSTPPPMASGSGGGIPIATAHEGSSRLAANSEPVRGRAPTPSRVAPPTGTPRAASQTGGSGVVMSRPAVIVGAPGARSSPTVPRIRKAREDEGRGFGQGLISEKSLDEVILAYLSEDADEK